MDEEEKARLEEQYRQSQKMEAIGVLFGGIAHDFNNILSVIMGYAEIARNKISDQDLIGTLLDNITKASRRAADLVYRILTFSRKTGREMAPVSVAASIQEALSMLRASFPPTIEIKPQILTAPGRDIIYADQTQIHQVLINLCTNAAQAMKKNSGIIEIVLDNTFVTPDMKPMYPELTPGAYLTISVNDTGHGMSHHVMENIFNPFFTTKKVGEGTGLGLSVVHGIVKGHGGAIDVCSDLEKGTTFTIFLPELIEPIKFEKATVIQEPPKGKERILFIDDDDAVVEVGELILKDLGYSVTSKRAGTDALELFIEQKDEFDLIITDMIMPVMTGDTLADKVLAIRPDIPIILCSGFTDIDTAEKAKAIGIKECIMKPWNRRNIANVIRKVLDE